MGIALRGKDLANKEKEKLKKIMEERKNSGTFIPKLAMILVGDDGGSSFYVNHQSKVCEDVGIIPHVVKLPSDVSQETIVNEIEKLNEDKEVAGVIIMMPLPKHIDSKFVLSKLDPKKDLDGLTETNAARLYLGEKCHVPCTPKGIVHLLKESGVTLSGARVVIIGRSNIVGKPLFHLMLQENATPTICHSKTKDIKKVCSEADIIICAIGRPKFLTSEYVKEGAVVVDVGTSSVNGKITGDVDFDDVITKASVVTPVPGGVGSVTNIMLLLNMMEVVDA
ncbi:MAG: bifunctional methylenetetrahydrofolate dehydrogenase/methenyltetrahydrofolate cyclohydrolase [Oscillospiraceae bacterium]|nr:bifunctional methylenetetrahydrofolate dehydrogenase/methenyltetrahydrofolate cyclohydrolase [Oscillospiraceae bacterium]